MKPEQRVTTSKGGWSLENANAILHLALEGLANMLVPNLAESNRHDSRPIEGASERERQEAEEVLDIAHTDPKAFSHEVIRDASKISLH